MAFVADAIRTWDPERAIELKQIGGGSDGVVQFRLDLPGASYHFSADAVFEPDPAFKEGGKGPRSRIVWRVEWHEMPIPGHDAAQTEAIIRDALTAYRGGHGAPELQAVRIDFGSV